MTFIGLTFGLHDTYYDFFAAGYCVFEICACCMLRPQCCWLIYFMPVFMVSWHLCCSPLIFPVWHLYRSALVCFGIGVYWDYVFVDIGVSCHRWLLALMCVGVVCFCVVVLFMMSSIFSVLVFDAILFPGIYIFCNYFLYYLAFCSHATVVFFFGIVILWHCCLLTLIIFSLCFLWHWYILAMVSFNNYIICTTRVRKIKRSLCEHFKKKQEIHIYDAVRSNQFCGVTRSFF